MTFYTPITVSRRRASAVERERPAQRPMRPKLVAAFLAFGILLLGGGGIFAATRPTWHPAKTAATNASRRAAAGTGAAATAAAVNPTASAASAGPHATSATAGVTAAHAQTGPGRGTSSSARSSAAKPRWQAGSKPAVTYTVKPGDTLSGIAAWFKLHGYGSLYAANRSVIGSNPALVFPGERITISHGVMSLRAATRQRSSAS